MSNKDMKQWLGQFESHKPSAEAECELNTLLENQTQACVKQLVRDLPEDTVSLQWRSSLNEKLLALAPVKKKISAVVIGFRALAGVGLASLFCLAVYSKVGSHAPSTIAVPHANSSQLASALLEEHRQSVYSGEIAGAGIVDSEPDAKKADQSDSDDSSDYDSL